MSEIVPENSIDKETLAEQLISINSELDLALRWKRPSILFAIYNSNDLRRSAQDSLEILILKSGQEVVHYQIEYERDLNLVQFIEEITGRGNAVYFIDPLNSEGKSSQIEHLVSMLNSCRGYMVDHLVRVVFWLTESEALSVAHQAPDFWASRHRVFEFIREITEEINSFPELETTKKIDRKQNPTISLPEINQDETFCESIPTLNFSEEEEPTGQDTHLLLMMGVASWKEGNYDKASNSLRAALAIAVSSHNQVLQVMCFKAIALVESDSDKIDDALQAYKQVAFLEPENLQVWNNIGSLFQKSGRYSDALSAFNNVLKINIDDPVSWNGLGSVYASTGRFDEAIDCFRKAIKYNAGYVTPWIKLGDVLIKQNRIKDALYAFMRIVEMDNKNVHAWSEIGSIYFKAGSFQQAIDAFKKSLILGVDSAVLYSDLADAYAHLGNYSEAMQNYQKAIEREIDNNEKAVLWNKYGDVFRRTSDYENAVSAYEIADKLCTSVSEVSNNNPVDNLQHKFPFVEKEAMIDFNFDKGQTFQSEQSKRDNSVIPELEKEQAVSKPMTSLMKDHQKGIQADTKFETADTILNQSNSSNSYLWVRLGSNYMKAGAFEKAVDAYRKAADLYPLDARVLCLLAQAHVQKMEFVEAISFYRKSIDLFDNDKEKALSYSQIGDIYRQMKQFANALEYYDVAIGLDPANNKFLPGLSRIQDDLVKYSNHSAIEIKPDMLYELGEKLVSRKVAVSETDRPQVVTKVEVVGELEASTQISVKVDLNNANVWNELGNILTKAKSFSEACDAYRKAIELNPDYGWAYSNMALIFAKDGKREDAIDLYLKSIGLLWGEGDKAVSWNRLGDVYRQVGKYAEAINAYQNADKLNQESFSQTAKRAVDIEQLFPHFVS